MQCNCCRPNEKEWLLSIPATMIPIRPVKITDGESESPIPAQEQNEKHMQYGIIYSNSRKFTCLNVQCFTMYIHLYMHDQGLKREDRWAEGVDI